MAGSLLLASGLAHAQFSSTVTATNDYDFRGYSQSAKDPALQVSADYAFSNGFAIGAWASNVDFEGVDDSADIEVDLYANYTGEISETTSWTAGVVYDLYPGGDATGEYPEFFVGLNTGPFALKQWFADDLYESGESAYYTEINATFELPQNFSLLAHAGYSHGDYWSDVNGDDVFDYSLGIGYTLGNFNLALKYTATDDEDVTEDVFNNEGRVVFSVATTFPWGD
ncbi:MAG: TorF family putative porin [Pseudomonadota bacterium]